MDSEQIALNIENVPFNVAKHIRDLDHTALLKKESFSFSDGDDEIVDLFAVKVGVNGNGFGVGLETFEKNIDQFAMLPIIVDPFGITHKNGKRTKEFIEKNQGALTVGQVTKIKKYDLDHDGKIDFARVLGHISKDEKKKSLYHNALAAGINETSPTILPLNLDEPVTNLLTWQPMNIAIVKDGAYLTDSKIVKLCVGKKETCHNALAAQLSHTPLITALAKSDYMADPNDGKGNSEAGSSASSPTNPLVTIFTNNPSNQPNPITKGETEPQKPDNNNKPEEKPAEETPEVKALRKENDELKEGRRLALLTEMAPIDLFDGKEEDQKAFIKQHKDLKEVETIYNFNKIYVPRFLKYYLAQQQSGTKVTENKKDDTGKKDDNPLAGALEGFPKFDNAATADPKDLDKHIYTNLNKMSLEKLIEMRKKNESRGGL